MTRAEREEIVARTNENRARYDAALAAITPEDREYLARIYQEILGGAENGDSTALRAPWEWYVADQVWQLTAIHRLREALEYALPIVKRYAHTQGDNAAYHAEIIAPIVAALGADPTEAANGGDA